MNSSLTKQFPKLSWLDEDYIRPYVYVREENKISNPGSLFKLDWFQKNPIYKNPLHVSEVDFADQILRLEGKAFESSNMAMPRWVFYDCAIIPGFVAGFAIKTEKLPAKMREVLKPNPGCEWSPLSLFIIIPTMGKGEWVAHNLCSVNSLVDENERFYGLGFLSKAYALWHANIEVCCGITQWGAHAIKLHSHYGAMEVLTSYTPVHSYARTLTYRLRVDPDYWMRFFDHKPAVNFKEHFRPAGFQIDPTQESSLRDLQTRIEKGQGPFFLEANEIRKLKPVDPLTVFQPK